VLSYSPEVVSHRLTTEVFDGTPPASRSARLRAREEHAEVSW
jgi:hypothetical protein